MYVDLSGQLSNNPHIKLLCNRLKAALVNCGPGPSASYQLLKAVGRRVGLVDAELYPSTPTNMYVSVNCTLTADGTKIFLLSYQLV